MGHLTMNKKERIQLIVFEKIKNSGLSKTEAGLQLGVTESWIRKKFKRYIENGEAGLVHRGRGQASKKRWCSQEKKLALDLLESDWHGFGPSFTAEKLLELKNIKVSKETVRQAMVAAGIWHIKGRRLKHRKRRERRARVGIMVQLDGSPHDWFEGRAGKCTLLVFIDDATSKILWLEFAVSESHIDVMRATKNYIMRYGKPHSFYVDFGGVFSVNLNNEERDKKTQWERALSELRIEVMHAHSPQAKGRVERVNATLQDRLVKEMRLAGISSIAQANQFLRESNFIAKHNQQFAVSPLQEGDAHKPIESYDLEEIFCLKEPRVLTNDYTITYNKKIFQVIAKQSTTIRPKDIITVNTHLNGSITLSIRKVRLAYNRIYAKPKKVIQEKQVKQPVPRKPCENSRQWAAGRYCGTNRVNDPVLSPNRTEG